MCDSKNKPKKKERKKRRGKKQYKDEDNGVTPLKYQNKKKHQLRILYNNTLLCPGKISFKNEGKNKEIFRVRKS